MRGRSSSSSSMEITKVNEAKEEPHLSGGYIRTLVKRLTTKDSLQSDNGLKEATTKNGECLSDENNNQKTHKKQVRRRLHTSKPYQERLLNMAEARREIVTALKFHRASMKQQQSSSAAAAAADNLDFQTLQDKKSKSRKAHSRYPSTTATAATTNSYSSLSWPIPMAPPSYHENQDFVLPSQTLGLTLNYQNFSNLDTNIYHKPMSMYSASSSSSTPSTSSVLGGEWTAGKSNSNSSGGGGGGGLHHAMDDEEMEEIRSLGEQHQIEWNDTINLVTSARWCNFLKSMEIEAGEGDDGFQQFDQIMEFPQWLINANESSCLEQHFDHHFSDAYFQDPALPCMDIGEIEAMDGEWLA